MIKVGKILGIRRFLGDFFDFFAFVDFFVGGWEQLGALGFFLRGFCWGGILFFGGWWGVFWIVSVGKN